MLGLGSIAGLFRMAVRWWAAGHLGKPKHLVTTGPYGYVRNPLYLGTFLLLVGLSSITGRAEIVAILSVSVVPLYAYKVRLEESGWEQKLGGMFRDYRAAVPAWIPRQPRYPLSQGMGFCWAQWLERREYHSLIIVLAVFLMIHVNEYVWEYVKR